MKKILLLLLSILLLTSCSKNASFDVDKVNVLKDIDEREFDFDIHATSYYLADMSTFEVLYKHNTENIILPASLTKLFTMDTVLSRIDDLSDTSSISYDDFLYLIAEDSSLAGMYADRDYTIEDLLYALMLPSGGDAALALSNYFDSKGMNLVDEMNQRCKELGCEKSHFTNTIGLHDDNLHTSIQDIYTVVMDLLTFKVGREVLTTLQYTLSDGVRVGSTTRFIDNEDVVLLGGKTGYTPEAGQSIVALYKHNYHSYLLILTNAMGKPSEKQYYHYEDCLKIFENLYN